MTNYLHDEKNNRIEGMSKEEIYALLADAIEQGELPVAQNTAFVTMFKSIVDGKAYKMAFCTQAQYNALKAAGELVVDALYIVTDDTTYSDLIEYIATLEDQIKTTDEKTNKALDIAVDFENNQVEITQLGLYLIELELELAEGTRYNGLLSINSLDATIITLVMAGLFIRYSSGVATPSNTSYKIKKAHLITRY